ncbi:MAG: hypothetical protein ACXWP0_12095 [Ktedonobacterales bacterium]
MDAAATFLPPGEQPVDRRPDASDNAVDLRLPTAALAMARSAVELSHTKLSRGLIRAPLPSAMCRRVSLVSE